MTTLQRIGYGSSFNTLTRYDNVIKKTSINARGHVKINNEIDFYDYVRNHNIALQLPRLISSNKEEHTYCMTYMDNYVPLYTVFPSYTHQQKKQILVAIRASLKAMHDKTRISADRTHLFAALRYEFYDKLMERYAEVESVLETYDYIRYVNGEPIYRIHTLVPALYEKVVHFFAEKQSPEYCLIHGDCQFNNILIHPETQDIVFIDPRASFGNEGSLFGIEEYDYAKVKFALSGYDIFDNQQVDHLHIEGNNLILEDMYVFKESDDSIENVLVALIWLGNAHCFKTRPLKAAYSYFYALSIASKLLYK